MKYLLSFAVLLFSIVSFSQEEASWKVLHNSKVLLSAREENPDKNSITISRAALANTGFLELAYRPNRVVKDWERTLQLLGEDEIELRTFNGNSFKLSNAVLRNLVKGRSRVLLYTVFLPKDPNKRALVRVRRVHLCTIQIKG